LLDYIGLRTGYTRGYYGQSARRIEAGDLPSGQTLAVQQRTDALTQFPRSGINHPRGNFFATDL